MNYHPIIAENQTYSHAGFQDIEKAGEEGIYTYVLFLVLFDGSTSSQNNNKDALIDGKEHDDDIQKSVSPDIHSLTSGAQTRKQGDKTKNKDNGKSHVVTITGFRDLNSEFKECNNNRNNGVNAASSLVSTAGHNFINSTNDLIAAGPSNAAMPNLEDLTHFNDADDVECINNSSNGVSAAGPSVFATGLDLTNSINDFTAAGPLVYAAELNFTNSTNDFSTAGPSNAAMPNLKDLSHNADDVGAEADTNNMESIISVSLILTTRIHKDYPTSQIIGDLSSTTQTRILENMDAYRDQDLGEVIVGKSFYREIYVKAKWFDGMITIYNGDFNEVRTEQEIYGLVFNVQGANAFNSFISLASLIDISLDDYAYTWAHKTANKIKEISSLKIVIKQWTKNAKKSSYKAKISIQSKLSDIDKILDQGGSNEEILSDRSLLLKELNDINSIDSLEALAIHETLVDGEWIVDLLAMKSVFLKYFSTQFSSRVTPRICFADQFTNWLSLEQQADLERNVSNEEIKSTTWDCGTNKSPGPDDFTFELFSRYWKLLEHDIVAVVKEFFASANRLSFVISGFISDVQSAFVSSHQILGGPFILNELLSWCKHMKFKAMVFKVDFEKAFDSIQWDYLQDILKMFGFGDKWCGIPIDSSLTLSHIFFADDAIFVEEVDASATTMGCSICTTFFVYLGVKVGGSMSRIKSWDDVVAKLSSRLSKWKLKTLSIGGRLTLIKLVLTSIPLYHMSIFKGPSGVLKLLGSTRRNFLMEWTGEKEKWIGLVGIRSQLSRNTVISGCLVSMLLIELFSVNGFGDIFLMILSMDEIHKSYLR
uniref:RNA-directed DNA polymerase, eukaryota n=1 Tax=Tanacetum cinerariifolium TaxID=118510 RepID=A0A699HLG2_TANCI|nr:hypothetical protein [Tanacetum cinerariifolium]